MRAQRSRCGRVREEIVERACIPLNPSVSSKHVGCLGVFAFSGRAWDLVEQGARSQFCAGAVRHGVGKIIPSEHVVCERARCVRASTLWLSEHVVCERARCAAATSDTPAQIAENLPFPSKLLLQHILVSGLPGLRPPPGIQFQAEALQWIGCDPPGPGAGANRPGKGYIITV